MFLVPQRLESRHRRVQPEETIQINHALPRDGDAWPHAVICLLAMRNNDVQPVSGAALEEDDQALLTRSDGIRGVHRAREKTRNHAGADNGQRAVLQEYSACDRHALLLRLLAIGFWLLAIGFWLLALGYWLLAIGSWLLALGY